MQLNASRNRGAVMRVLLRAVVAGVIAGALLSTPAAAAAPDGWLQDGYGPGNTGVNPAEHTVTAANVGKLRYRWSLVSPVVRGSCNFQTPPVVAGGRLFLPDQAGFGAYNAATGARVWRHAYSSAGDSVPPKFAVAGSTLLAAGNTCGSTSDPDGDLTAYNAATGAVRWTVHRDAPMWQLVVDGDVIAIGGGDAGDDVVSAYRLADGARLWTRSGVELGAGASAAGRLLLTRVDHSGAVAVNLATGKALWSTPADLSVNAADPSGHRFYATRADGALVAVDAKTGAVAWTRPAVTPLGASAALATDATRLYIASDEHLIALRATDGAKLWDVDLYGEVYRPIEAGGVLYVAAHSQPLAMLDPATGESLDPDPLIADTYGHPVLAAGRLYVTTGRILDAFSL
jgi:outer membrane protein assembly factor BamB